MIIHLYSCMCATWVPGVHSGQKTVLDLLELALQTIVSLHVRARNQTPKCDPKVSGERCVQSLQVLIVWSAFCYVQTDVQTCDL